jgi:hypothetical protein
VRVLEPAELDLLARQGQWSTLWDRVRELPLHRAVSAVRLFGDWLPADEASRALFVRLGAGGAVVAAAAAPAATTVPVRFTSHLAFAPDLTGIAVQPMLSEPAVIEVYGLSDGSRQVSLAVSGSVSPWPGQLVYVGDGVVHLEWWEDDRRRWRVVRHRGPGWSREVLAESVVGHAVCLGAVAGGFVVLAPHHFLLGTADGPLGEPVPHPALAHGEARLLATDPVSGRMAVALDSGRLIVFAADMHVLGATDLHHSDAYDAWFCGPDTLVTHGMSKAIRSWRIEDGSLVVQGHTWLPKDDVQHGEYTLPLGLTALPSRRRLAFARRYEPPLWYDATTLEAAAAPAVFGERFPVWMSTGERCAVFQDHRGLQVHDMASLELARLATSAPADITSADLDLLRSLRHGGTRAVRTACELLRAYLHDQA